MEEGLKLELRGSLSPTESQEVTAPTERHFPGDVPEQEVSPREEMSNSKAGEWTRRMEGLAGALRSYDPQAGSPPGVRSCLERQEGSRKREEGQKN